MCPRRPSRETRNITLIRGRDCEAKPEVSWTDGECVHEKHMTTRESGPGRESKEENSHAIMCIDSFPYFGTDDLYLNYVAQVVKEGGRVGIAGAGLMREVEAPPPEHLREWWTQDLWCLHSANGWRRHWDRTGIMDVEVGDTMPDGWQFWLDWHKVVAPNNQSEIEALEADQGRQ